MIVDSTLCRMVNREEETETETETERETEMYNHKLLDSHSLRSRKNNSQALKSALTEHDLSLAEPVVPVFIPTSSGTPTAPHPLPAAVFLRCIPVLSFVTAPTSTSLHRLLNKHSHEIYISISPLMSRAYPGLTSQLLH